MDVKTFIGNYIEGLPEATVTEIKNGVLMVRTDTGEMKKVDSSNLGSSEIYYATYNVTTYDDIVAAKNDGKLVVVVSPERGGTSYVVLTQYSSYCAGQFTYETERGAAVATYKVSSSGWEYSVKPLAGVSQVEALEALVPDAASEDNQLTDKSYVDNQMNQVAAKYLSQDEDGNPFDTYEAFEAAQTSGDFYYAGTVTEPTKNDYVLVSSDSQHDNKVTRYWYTGSSWSFQYVVNNTPFTDAEWDAINSGITAEKVAEFDNKLDAISHDDTMDGEGTEESPLSVNEMVGASEEETSVKIGDRVYPVVKIGNQLWITENLDYKFSGVDIAPSDTPITPAAWYYNNDETTYGVNGNKYGLLYNWIAVKYLEDNKETLLPEGWHVPSAAEWDALANAVGGTGVAGTKLKSTTGWSGGNGTDDFGFSGFPAGYRYSGSFSNVGSYAFFWTATESSSTGAYYRSFSTDASMNSAANYKTDFACSVRLVKDATSGGSNGKKGLVPQPKADDINKVLSGAGTWVNLPNKTSQLENDSGFIEGTITEISESDVDELDWGGFAPDNVVTILGRQYRTVTVGDQTWLAENLAYDDNSGNGIYTSPRGNVYYTLAAAKRIADSVEGWRLPNNEDFDKLLRGISTSVRETYDGDGDRLFRYVNANDNIRAKEFYDGLDTIGFGVTAAGGYEKFRDGGSDVIKYEDSTSHIWGTTGPYYDIHYYRMDVSKNYGGTGSYDNFSNNKDVDVWLASENWAYSVRLVKE